MSTKNILDFVAALATGQSAEAVDFARAELKDRLQTAVTAYGTGFRYKVEGQKNDDSTTG